MELRLELGDGLRRDLRILLERGEIIAGRERHEQKREQRDAQQERNHVQQPFENELPHRNQIETWQKISARASEKGNRWGERPREPDLANNRHRLAGSLAPPKRELSPGKYNVRLPRMKNWICIVAAFVAAIFCFSGCGKKSETRKIRALNYPLPDPPLVADCHPGIPGGRLVLSTFADPKTFNPITANEQSSRGNLPVSFCLLARRRPEHGRSHAGPGRLVDEFAGQQNVDVSSAKKSALERRPADHRGRRGVHLQ